jgi:hypothetical protein
VLLKSKLGVEEAVGLDVCMVDAEGRITAYLAPVESDVNGDDGGAVVVLTDAPEQPLDHEDAKIIATRAAEAGLVCAIVERFTLRRLHVAVAPLVVPDHKNLLTGAVRY